MALGLSARLWVSRAGAVPWVRVVGISALVLMGTILSVACSNSNSNSGDDESVEIEWVTVGGAGNAGDPQQSCIECEPGTTFGSVAEEYRIGMFEVTNAQYTAFLNAVAAADPNGLYNTNMMFESAPGGITRSGDPGNYMYDTIAGRESHPVNYVSFYDSLRFANWLHNGQLTGPQGSATTEDGAYTITTQGIADNSITRNVGATVFVPSEDEWYKAAYYDTDAMIYYDFPAGTDTKTVCAASEATANTANCDHGFPEDLSDVGSYTGAESPNGTFDQGGNLWEWNESVILAGMDRGKRGGSFSSESVFLGVSRRSAFPPTIDDSVNGFRVASLVR